MNISRDEWLKALGDAVVPVDPDAVTCPELAEQFGFSRRAMQEHLRGLIEKGKAVRVTGMRNGRRVIAYKLTKGKR